MSKNYSNNNQFSKHTFKRKQVSKPLPSNSKLTKLLDDFIQNSLIHFKYTEVLEKIEEITSEYSKHLLSSKPEIPDLVIYNTPFNKNDCFVEGIHCSEYNPFPRVKFEVNVKPLEQSLTRNITEKVGNNFYNDDEEVEWEDVNAKDLQNTQVTFQKIPGTDDKKDDILKLDNEEVSKVINVNSLFGVTFPIEPPKNTNVLFSTDEKTIDPFKEVVLENNIIKPLSNNEIINMNNHNKLPQNGNITKETLNTNNIINKNDMINRQIKENDSLFSDLSLINRNIPTQIDDYGQYTPKLPFLNEGYKEFLEPSQDAMIRQQRMMNNNYRPPLKNSTQFGSNNNNFNNFGPNQMNLYNNAYNNYNNNFNQLLNYNCPENFLEDPLFLVKRNINVKGWHIKENDRLVASMNSYELLLFLENRFKNEKQGLNNIWIFDSMSDIYYTPITLYEVLKENSNLLLPQIQNRFPPIPNQMQLNGNNFMIRNNANNFNQEEFLMSGKNEPFVNNPTVMGFPYMGPSPNHMMHQSFPQTKFSQFPIPNLPVNVNMNINLMQGELNVNSVFSPQNNNFNHVNNKIYSNPNENIYLNNFNNLYNSMKSNPNMKKILEKKN